mmetsp:Transcript_27912/g.39242  ORF Transcript_27912/g.39242 Transcript_27912/m.39242 type:complete len:484 (+) Transcript_27912:259-1710(+)
MERRRKRQLLATNTLLNSGVYHQTNPYHSVSNNTCNDNTDNSSSKLSVVRLSSSLHIRTLDESLHRTYGDPARGGLSCSLNGHPDHRVKFDTITIREYERILGDNPSCLFGPPISLGWGYVEQGSLSVDLFESSRPPRRTNKQMLLPRAVRRDMLMSEWNVSRSEMANIIRQTNKIKNQRRTTVQRIDDGSERLVNRIETIIRKLKKSLKSKRKKTSYQVSQMQKQADRAAAVLAQMSVEENEEIVYNPDNNFETMSVSSSSTTSSTTSSLTSSQNHLRTDLSSSQPTLLPPLLYHDDCEADHTEQDLLGHMTEDTITTTAATTKKNEMEEEDKVWVGKVLDNNNVVIQEKSGDFFNEKPQQLQQHDDHQKTTQDDHHYHHCQEQSGGQESSEGSSSSATTSTSPLGGATSPASPTTKPTMPVKKTMTSPPSSPIKTQQFVEEYQKLADERRQSVERLKANSLSQRRLHHHHPTPNIVITETD